MFDRADLYAPPALLTAYESASKSVTRLYVTTSTNPYDIRTFDTVRDLREMLAGQASAFGSGARILVGGPSAEFADVQTTISADFLRVAVITTLGILLVLILLLRAVVAPLYLVLTVLVSYAASLSLSAFLLSHVFAQQGINYFIPLMVFVLLVALGSDYNIFLMSRVREESHGRPLRQGIRAASARTGTVITSAGLILAGTSGAHPLRLCNSCSRWAVVALGVLIDTFWCATSSFHPHCIHRRGLDPSTGKRDEAASHYRLLLSDRAGPHRRCQGGGSQPPWEALSVSLHGHRGRQRLLMGFLLSGAGGLQGASDPGRAERLPGEMAPGRRHRDEQAPADVRLAWSTLRLADGIVDWLYQRTETPVAGAPDGLTGQLPPSSRRPGSLHRHQNGSRATCADATRIDTIRETSFVSAATCWPAHHRSPVRRPGACRHGPF
jgi:hypothetical protein